MAYRVIFDKRALKELQDLTEPWRSRVAESIHGLAENPRARGVIKVRAGGPIPAARLRLSRDLRHSR